MVENCPRCGTPNSPGYRYCSSCGAPLPGREAQNTAPESDTQASGGFAVQRWEQGEAQDASTTDPSTIASSEKYASDRGGAPSARSPISGEVLPPVDPLSPPLRADLPPGAAERPDKATFVPYTDDAIRKLEKQKSDNAWLMPTIYGAGAILAVLVVVTIYLLLSNGKATPGSQIASTGAVPTLTLPSTAPIAPTVAAQPVVTWVPTIALAPLNPPNEVGLPCALPSGATADQTIIYTVCHSSEEQASAWQNLDSEVLKGSRTGFDLQDNIARVEKYKADKQYATAILHKLVVLAMKVDQDSALVQTAEVWSVTTYSSVDKSVVSKSDPTPYSEVYHLVKQNEKWFIDRVDFLPSTSPGN